MTRASLRHTMNYRDLLNLFRSSRHQRCSVKKGVLKTFANFTCVGISFLITLLVFRPATLSKSYRRSHQKCSIKAPVQESLFVKVVGLQTCNFMKKRLRHRCFPVNIMKFLRKPTLKNTYEQLLLKIGVIHKGCLHKFGNFWDPPPPVQVCPH